MLIDVWVTVIDVDREVYDGPRIQVSATEEDAWLDLAEWLRDTEEVVRTCPAAYELIRDGFQVRGAMDAWAAETGKFWKIERQQLIITTATNRGPAASRGHVR